jgi:hypothetical protein
MLLGPFQAKCLPETARLMYTLNDTLPFEDNFYNDMASNTASGTAEAQEKHHWKTATITVENRDFTFTT